METAIADKRQLHKEEVQVITTSGKSFLGRFIRKDGSHFSLKCAHRIQNRFFYRVFAYAAVKEIYLHD